MRLARLNVRHSGELRFISDHPIALSISDITYDEWLQYAPLIVEASLRLSVTHEYRVTWTSQKAMKCLFPRHAQSAPPDGAAYQARDASLMQEAILPILSG